MDDPVLAMRIAREGRRLALSRFSVERYCAELISHIRGVAGHAEPGTLTHLRGAS
jgi:hypothetical protein